MWILVKKIPLPAGPLGRNSAVMALGCPLQLPSLDHEQCIPKCLVLILFSLNVKDKAYMKTGGMKCARGGHLPSEGRAEIGNVQPFWN